MVHRLWSFACEVHTHEVDLGKAGQGGQTLKTQLLSAPYPPPNIYQIYRIDTIEYLNLKPLHLQPIQSGRVDRRCHPQPVLGVPCSHDFDNFSSRPIGAFHHCKSNLLGQSHSYCHRNWQCLWHVSSLSFSCGGAWPSNTKLHTFISRHSMGRWGLSDLSRNHSY